MFYCKSCSFDCQCLASFRKHHLSKKHVLGEVDHPGNGELDPVTRLWGKNYAAKPEYATAQIAVWWDMKDCPIPDGYDARQVRPIIEGAFKRLGYSGPVSIIAFGDQTQTPDHLLRALSSTGVDFAHTIPERIASRMASDMMLWRRHNPPPATIMLISDQVEECFSDGLVRQQQQEKYNLCLAYSCRPYKMSVLVTSVEWLWDSLLTDRRTQFLQKCSGRVVSTGMFHCKSCFSDCKGLDNFSKHLSSKEHLLEEASMYSSMRFSNRERMQRLKVLTFPKSRRLRKTPRMGFRSLLPKRTKRSEIFNLQERVEKLLLRK